MPLRSQRSFLVAFACVAVAAACGGDGDGDGGEANGSGLAVAVGPSGASSEAGAEALLPPLGRVEAWLEPDALVSVLANEASRGAILEALAQATGFEPVVVSQAGLQQPVSLLIQHEPVELVLARILIGVPHSISFETDPLSGQSQLRVTVGAEGASPAAVAASPPARSERSAPRRELTPEQRQERAERSHKLWAESLEKLQSSDAEIRADGTQWLNVNSTEGFQAAVERLADDESPIVRAAAAEALLDSDVGAVQPLLQALEDPDPRVVLAALEALEFVGDTSTVPQIAPLLKHKDVEVRERTVEAIEFLQ